MALQWRGSPPADIEDPVVIKKTRIHLDEKAVSAETAQLAEGTAAPKELADSLVRYYSVVMRNLAPRDGKLYLMDSFLPPAEAAETFRALLSELDWQEESIFIAGRRVKVPRLICWYGDPGAVYTYSGSTHSPLPWTPTLQRLKRAVEAISAHRFNSVLGNLYRDGNDSMGWHADKERELGANPCIASLSLGETRLFRLRHNRTKETVDLPLASGSLLIMSGSLQHHWRHCVPKSRRAQGPRINLTFRLVLDKNNQ